MLLLAGVVAFLSAFTAAWATSLQHLAAGRTPSSVTSSFGLIKHLARRPLWLFGQALSVIGLTFHATALHLGSIPVVQPIIISGAVLAIVARAALSRRLPWPREILAVTIAAAGLATFLVASKPSPGRQAAAETPAALLCAGAVVVALVVAQIARRVRNQTYSALCFGFASGMLFGVIAGLIKAVLHVAAAGGIVGLLTSWMTYALVVIGVAAVINNQQSYRRARLSASMPMLNIVDGIVALAFGWLAFDSVPRHSPLFVLIEVAGFAAITVGLVLVARLEEADTHPKPEAASLPDPSPPDVSLPDASLPPRL